MVTYGPAFFKGVKSSVDRKKKPSLNFLNKQLLFSTFTIFFSLL